MIRTVLAFAGTRVEIGCEGDAAEELLRFVWSRHLSDDPADGVPYLFLRAVAPSRFQLIEQDRGDVELNTVGALDALIERGTYLLARANAGGLLLHAAVLSDARSRAVLCPGASGTGKSSLTAWLSGAGYAHLTDELGFVPNDTNTVTGLGRPVCFKLTGLRVVDRCFPAHVGTEGIRCTTNGVMIPPDVLGPRPVSSLPDLTAIVFPKYEPDAPLTLRPLTAGDTTIRLMATLVNACNLERHGLSEASRLATQVRAFELSGDNFQRAAELIANVL